MVENWPEMCCILFWGNNLSGLRSQVRYIRAVDYILLFSFHKETCTTWFYIAGLFSEFLICVAWFCMHCDQDGIYNRFSGVDFFFHVKLIPLVIQVMLLFINIDVSAPELLASLAKKRLWKKCLLLITLISHWKYQRVITRTATTNR